MAEILLIDAVKQGDLEQVRKLLIDDINVNEENYWGNTALIWAARQGHFEIASLLLECGAVINQKNKGGYTPLYYACDKNYPLIVSLLIEKGVDLNIKNMIGLSPLMISAFFGYFSIVSLLLNGGADASLLDYSGKSAVDKARERNNSKCVSILENYQHFHRYRKVWLSFASTASSFQDNQNQESKHNQSQIQSPSLMRMMDSSDLVRFVTEFM